MEADPATAVLKARWKPSRLGGRAWATPAATSRQLQAVRRTTGRAAHSSAALSSVAEVSLPGTLGRRPLETLQALMAVVGNRAGVAFRQADPREEQPPAGSWRRAQDLDPTAPPGRIRVYLETPGDVTALSAMLHGRAVQLGGDLVAVEVRSDLLDARTGNGRRGRGGPAPGPGAQAPGGR